MENWTAILITAAITATLAMVFSGLPMIFKHGKWQGQVDSSLKGFDDRLKGFERTLDRVKDEIGKIRSDVQNVFARLPSESLVRGDSPLGLTDRGKHFARKLRAHEWAGLVSREAVQRVSVATPYDVQNECLEFAKDFKNEDWRAFWKDCAYQEGVKMDGVYEVLAVVLRDEVLSKIEVQRAGPPGGIT